MSNEQTHPLHAVDKKIIDTLIIKETPQDFVQKVIDLEFLNLFV